MTHDLLFSIPAQTWIPAAALIVSVLVFAMGTLRSVRTDTEKLLMDRIQVLGDEVQELREELKQCERRSRALTRALADLQNGGGGG